MVGATPPKGGAGGPRSPFGFIPHGPYRPTPSLPDSLYSGPISRSDRATSDAWCPPRRWYALGRGRVVANSVLFACGGGVAVAGFVSGGSAFPSRSWRLGQPIGLSEEGAQTVLVGPRCRPHEASFAWEGAERGGVSVARPEGLVGWPIPDLREGAQPTKAPPVRRVEGGGTR